MTDAPRISLQEARALAIAMLPEDIRHLEPHASDVARAEQALAAFMLARVPDAKPVDFHKPGMGPLLSGGEWNACRDAVLKGTKT